MVAVDRSHGKLVPGCRLARISHGKVPCMNIATTKTARCRFKRGRSGRWLESKKGPDFAMVGDSLSRTGARAGNFIVAAKRSGARTVPCRKPPPRGSISAADTQGVVESGQELSAACVVEDGGAEYNALSANFEGARLFNYATRMVCSNNDPQTNPHPDGAQLAEALGDGVFCYRGWGAALNDINGTERDERGFYLAGEEHCHYMVNGGFEVPAAKRPASTSYPFPGKPNPKSPILWRPVNPNVRFGN